jgi:hypothetical protein
LPVNFWISGSWTSTVSLQASNVQPSKAITHVKSHENIVLLQNMGQYGVARIRDFAKIHTFSSPIVNLPWVCLFSLAKASSFLTGSDCRTLIPNLTLPLVYSWPGCKPR